MSSVPTATLQTFKDTITRGLTSRSIHKASKWAESYRVMAGQFPGPWSFRMYPWTREIHDCEAELTVSQKAAQMGLTEAVLNVVFFKMDILHIDCLYALPTQTPDASDFSASRFDPAIELSPHLTALFSDVKNVGHKRAGAVNLYIRGAKSPSGFKSIPVGHLVLDEIDEMPKDKIPLATERLAGQLRKSIQAISTPTVPGGAINKMFLDSTQEHFFFNCPSCGRATELLFPDCLIITATDIHDPKINQSYLACKECKAELPHKEKEEWLRDGFYVPKFPGRDSRGFYVNQLYSFTKTPAELAKSFLKSEKDPAAAQQFYNSMLGLPHISENAKLELSDINSCLDDYSQHDRHEPGLVTMGVDVGTVLHYEICSWTMGKTLRAKVLRVGKLDHFEELDALMSKYRISSCCIDANPERRKAAEFAYRFRPHVKMVYYGNDVSGREISYSTEFPSVTVDRTSWLDLSLGRFRKKTIAVPKDLPQEYSKHLCALIRVFKEDKDKNLVAKYINLEDDHYGHARNYCEIACAVAEKYTKSRNLGHV